MAGEPLRPVVGGQGYAAVVMLFMVDRAQNDADRSQAFNRADVDKFADRCGIDVKVPLRTKHYKLNCLVGEGLLTRQRVPGGYRVSSAVWDRCLEMVSLNAQLACCKRNEGVSPIEK